MKLKNTYREEPIDFGDIQGLVRFGHGRLVEAEFLLLTIADRATAQAWLESAPVTSAATQDVAPAAALQFAITAAGLRAFGLSAEIMDQFPQPYLSGMSGEESRSRRLGDTGTNEPSSWIWNGADAHVLLLLYAKKGGLKDWKREVLGLRFEAAFEQVQSMPTRPNGGFEPFGFADGISEPKVDWQQAQPPSKHGREDYANLISPGEVVLGPLNEYNERAASPEISAGQPGSELLPDAPGAAERRDLGRNGTYLVFRQLEQDVRGFWAYMDQSSGGDPVRREALAAAMVGRTRDGTPLIQDRVDIAGSPQSNDFTYEGDVSGVVCPLGAHIRRANPRTGDHPHGISGRLAWLLSTLGFRRRRDRLPGRHDLVASTRFHRLVRRGRVYGPELSPEAALKSEAKKDARGLFFICLCADIVRQFEFVQNAWIAAPKFNGLDGEADPLLGNRMPLVGVPADGFSIQHVDGVAERHTSLPQFVAVKGGGYFFLPGLRALQFIARYGR